MIQNRPASMTTKPTIGIAGGGLLGRLLAWRLLRLGCTVSVYEQDEAGVNRSAGWTAAGMISPMSELVSAEPDIFAWGMESLRIWPTWIQALTAETGCPVSFSKQGSLVVAHPRDEAELRQFKQDIRRKLTGLPEGASIETRLEDLDAGGLHRHEPALSGHLKSGFYLPEEGQVHSRELMMALHQAILTRGGHWYAGTPVAAVEPGRLVVGSHDIAFDWTIDVRGMGARHALPQLRGVRGEVMLIESREVHFLRPIRLMHPRYKLYVVPRSGHQLFIGATEIESEDYSPISLQSSLELGSALYTLNPALAEARILESASNCRPALPDNLPCVNVEPGYLALNGCYRHGYLLAPALIEKSLAQLPFIQQLIHPMSPEAAPCL